MKTINSLIFLLHFLLSISSNAQSKINFTFDSSGNQINRVVVLARAENTVYKSAENLTPLDYSKIGKILYYPNPVKDELYLSWVNENNNPIENIIVYNINGQLIKSYVDLKSIENTTVDFQSCSEGLYSVKVSYQNGEEEVLKIIKK